MSHAAYPTYIDLEYHAARAESMSLRLRRRLQRMTWGVRAAVFAWWLAHLLREFANELRSFPFGSLDAERAGQVSDRLGRLCRILHEVNAVSERAGLDRRFGFRRTMVSCQESAELLEDVLEAWLLSRDEDFRAIVNTAIGDLNGQKQQENSPVAALRD